MAAFPDVDVPAPTPVSAGQLLVNNPLPRIGETQPMKNNNSPKDLSLAAAFWVVGSLTLPIVAFCLLREALPPAAYSERSTRVVWLTWTGLATAALAPQEKAGQTPGDPVIQADAICRID